ncbi:lipid-A-disaccharide synthase [Aquabacter sp. L1I39]|uniref:lipid-A-disaccharide synthase n=1 Tax=Aquabacter sp. L1I39 TaxID=2820278 RepID=UPI001ADB2A66|nr:lipid-A-disaccharide synthase [Aquabacter sp. L1I39]QTL03609.1 lipid-A-disaccharide synthase [Aquabacter sp. L1I39]
MALPARPLRVFIVAGEESGDQLGGALMESLLRLAPHGAAFEGVGGPRMAAAGLTSRYPMDDLTAIGFGQVLGKLPLILRRLGETVDAICAAKPDVLVLVDAPDFTHRVADRVRRRAPDIAIVKYVSPTVWAWRPGRARAMRPSIDRLLALLPFEPQVHERLGGPPTLYVGHPLLERLGDLRPSPAELARRSALPARVLVLPGSRRSEVERLGAVFGAALGEVARSHDVEFVLPTLPRRLAQIEALTTSWPVQPRILTDEKDKYAAFRTARAALAASGTVTLELALAGVPTVAAYRVAGWEAVIAPYILTIPSVILPNLVLGENAVPEFLQHDCTPQKLAEALGSVLADGEARQRQEEAFRKLDGIFGTLEAHPSERAARAVLELVAERARH